MLISCVQRKILKFWTNKDFSPSYRNVLKRNENKQFPLSVCGPWTAIRVSTLAIDLEAYSF
jgi:hypothetical protein